ncbi:MAG: hypothetical protein LBJ76_01105 [Candidatus Accumulibacter sp.]|nr:hypothetical protein [Accumulibacter sp.]
MGYRDVLGKFRRKKTRLDYRQWAQVRTPEFKRWFGDWENDPANASKVVDPETGEPKVVYHGSRNAGFSIFDTEGKGKTRDTGAWFTGDRRTGRTYSTSDAEIGSMETDSEFNDAVDGFLGFAPVP